MEFLGKSLGRVSSNNLASGLARARIEWYL